MEDDCLPRGVGGLKRRVPRRPGLHTGGLATPAAPPVPTFPSLKQVQPPMSDRVALNLDQRGYAPEHA